MNDREIVDRLINNVNLKIDSCTEKEIKDDMKQIVVSLVDFVGSQDARILDPNTDPDEIGKLFFKMIGNIAMDAMNPFTKKTMAQKFEKVMLLHPLLKKYSNVD